MNEYLETKRSAVFISDECGGQMHFQGCLRLSDVDYLRGTYRTHYCFIGGLALPVSRSQSAPNPLKVTVEGPFEVLWSWLNRQCPFDLAVAFKTCAEGPRVALWDDAIDYVVYFPNAAIERTALSALTQGLDDESAPVTATVTLHADNWELYKKALPKALPAGLPASAIESIAYSGSDVCAALSTSCNQPYEPGCRTVWVGGQDGLLYVRSGDTWINKQGTGGGQLDLSDDGMMDVLAIFCADQTVLVSAENGCIYRSADGGQTWQTPSDCTVMAVSFAAYLNTIYAAGAGLWRSTDDGKTWSKVLEGNFVSVYFDADGNGVAITATDCYLSVDGGATWFVVGNSGLANQKVAQIAEGRVWVAGDGMAYSRDQGETWTKISSDAWEDFVFVTCRVGYRVGEARLEYTLDGGFEWWPMTIIGHAAQHLYDLALCDSRLIMGGENGFVAEMLVKEPLIA